jgi:hypothetical protein
MNHLPSKAAWGKHKKVGLHYGTVQKVHGPLNSINAQCIVATEFFQR